MSVTRERKVEQSVQDWVLNKMRTEYDLPEANVVMLDSFPYNRFDGPLDKTYVSMGFNFDPGSRPAEMGSTLRSRDLTIEFYVFGNTEGWGELVANSIKAAIEDDFSIPLLDYGVSQTPPIIGFLEVTDNGASSERAPIRDPKPWEENIFIVRVKVQDTYFA